MKFETVEHCLRYALGADGWSHYGESTLAPLIYQAGGGGDDAMSHLDHVAQAGLINQAMRATLSPLEYALIFARYAQHDNEARWQMVGRLVDWAPEPVEDCEAYTLDQIGRWARLAPAKTQAEWAQALTLSTAVLNKRNRPLLRWLDEELDCTCVQLSELYGRKGWV